MPLKKHWTEWVFIVLGVLNILFAAFGFLYNSLSFYGFIKIHEIDKDTPYFNQAFIIMSTICIFYYIMLLITGIQLIRRKVFWIKIFIMVLILEVLFPLTIGISWLPMGPISEDISTSVAAATGISMGGLAPQLIIWYPLWGIILAIIAKKKYDKFQKINILHPQTVN